jgi:predicted RNA methylase
MARLQAKSKLLYYPTPISVAIFIATYFSTVGKKLRIVDPCCGTGDAIREIADRIVGAPGTEKTVLGIELSYARAEEAKKVIDRVLPVSFYNVATANALWPQHSVSLLFNNPPYDWSEYEETLEGVT